VASTLEAVEENRVGLALDRWDDLLKKPVDWSWEEEGVALGP
jgi:hypothetical protein